MIIVTFFQLLLITQNTRLTLGNTAIGRTLDYTRTQHESHYAHLNPLQPSNPVYISTFIHSPTRSMPSRDLPIQPKLRRERNRTVCDCYNERYNVPTEFSID